MCVLRSVSSVAGITADTETNNPEMKVKALQAPSLLVGRIEFPC